MKYTLLISIFFASLLTQADIQVSRDYKGAVSFIHALAAKYPTTTKLMTLGASDGGIAIEGLIIGDGPIKNLLVATHHGNEFGSSELAINFAESLAQNPIQGQTITIIPVLNIEGYNRRDRFEKVNSQSLDLNRDYPSPCGTSGPFFSKSTKALADYIEKNDIVVSSTIHTFSPAVLYPWGISTNDVETGYTPKFTDLGNAATFLSHYAVGNSTLLLYPADGAFEDYAFWKHGIWSMLFEVGTSHNPSLKSLTTMIETNVPGLRKMYETAPTSRAEGHDFKGRCDASMKMMDLHSE